MMQQSSLAFLVCDSVKNWILQVFQRELKKNFQILFEPLFGMFGLPGATEQLSLFRLWLCENYILQVFQRELQMSFQILFEPSSSIK